MMDEHEELVNSYVQNGNGFKFFKRRKSGKPFHFENMFKLIKHIKNISRGLTDLRKKKEKIIF